MKERKRSANLTDAMVDCRLCKHLKRHPKTEHGYTCIAYKGFPNMVIYVPGKSDLGCDYYEQKEGDRT